MLSQIVALILSYFAFVDARRRCFARHAFLAALAPFLLSFAFIGLRLIGINISLEIVLGAASLDLVSLAGAGAGMYVARRIADRFAPAYDAYFAAL